MGFKTTASVLAFAAAARAHYTFDRLEVNGEEIGTGYIREHTRGYMPTKGQEILENDFRCQPGGESGANTDVYTVGPGDSVSFLGAFGMNSIEHPGPAQVYMSLSDDVKSDDGSGEWFKIQDTLFCSDPGNDGALTTAWCTWGEPGIAFTIPDTIPDGEYLVRVEHIPLHGAQGTPTGAEYYYACGQLKVEGSTTDALGDFDFISIPGGVQPDDEAVMFNIWTDVSEYPYTVGPSLIPGGSTWGSADGSSDSVVVNGGGESSSSSGSSSSSSGNSSSETETSAPTEGTDAPSSTEAPATESSAPATESSAPTTDDDATVQPEQNTNANEQQQQDNNQGGCENSNWGGNNGGNNWGKRARRSFQA